MGQQIHVDTTLVGQVHQSIKVDHAFGQLRQMKDGQLQGVNAEDLLNEL